MQRARDLQVDLEFGRICTMISSARRTAIDEELRARINRLVSGDHRPEDIARIYAGKRFQSFGRASFREIGDFSAHPNERDRGPVNGRIQEMLSTFLPMFDGARGQKPTLEAILARADSNFRMATDEQINRICFGMPRKKVEKILSSAIMKMRTNLKIKMSPEEELVLIALGDRVIWNPAFRGDEVFEDFKAVIVKNKLLPAPHADKLNSARDTVILHAIAAMHGAAYTFGDVKGELKAGYANPHGCLEITATLAVQGFEKPVSMKIGLLWTDLPGKTFCNSDLLDASGPWDFPIEIRGGKLERI